MARLIEKLRRVGNRRAYAATDLAEPSYAPQQAKGWRRLHDPRQHSGRRRFRPLRRSWPTDSSGHRLRLARTRDVVRSGMVALTQADLSRRVAATSAQACPRNAVDRRGRPSRARHNAESVPPLISATDARICVPRKVTTRWLRKFVDCVCTSGAGVREDSTEPSRATAEPCQSVHLRMTHL